MLLLPLPAELGIFPPPSKETTAAVLDAAVLSSLPFG
jgi:hypothetical protein